jgi:dTDP-4-dehydrorhamnose reductase
MLEDGLRHLGAKLGFKLLLTENHSALGGAICHGLEEAAFTVVCPSADFDWQDVQAFEHFLDEHKPCLAINTLAYVDALLGRALASAGALRGVPCMHLSSYRVFGVGQSFSEGCSEAQEPVPDDEYGQQLHTVEREFLALPKGIVLRLPWLVHHRGDNIFTRVASRLQSGDAIEVSDIHRGCPVTVDDVARVVVAMVQQILCGAENWGTFHMHAADSCSEAEFADHVARLLEKQGAASGHIEVLRNHEYRIMPGCALLKGSRCMNNFGIQFRSWRQGMGALMDEWLAAQVES